MGTEVCAVYRRTGRIEVELITGAEAEELEELKLLVDEGMGRIRGQLEAAREARIMEGAYADPVWYRKAQGALRVMGQVSQRVQMELGKRKRARIAAERPRAMDLLMRACDEVLPESMRKELFRRFRALLDESPAAG